MARKPKGKKNVLGKVVRFVKKNPVKVAGAMLAIAGATAAASKQKKGGDKMLALPVLPLKKLKLGKKSPLTKMRRMLKEIPTVKKTKSKER